MPPQFQVLPGTFDVLPPESARYEAVVAAFAATARRHGFALIVSPLIEDVGVFHRVGEATDIVRKEMYDFEDKGGRHITLRPEATAAVARAYVEHRPTTPWKVWYVTPKFRYERPQAGRYRQHHEVGLEAIGTTDPDLDVEIINLGWRFYESLGLTRIVLRLTSLGDGACRPAYRAELLAFLTERRDRLCGEHRDRIEANPLRILDCKRAECIDATKDAPRMLDRLCDDCAAHFTRVKSGLDALGVPYEVDPTLVRGLDYYTRTTFEFMAEAVAAAQNGAGGGGRYDALVENLGGPPTPGIGFGLGIERILLACDAEAVLPVPTASPALDVFVVDTTGGDMALAIATALRQVGFAADRAFDNRSMKAQLKAADRSGARFAIIIGDDEREHGKVTVRDMTTHEQEGVALDDLAARLRERLSG